MNKEAPMARRFPACFVSSTLLAAALALAGCSVGGGGGPADLPAAVVTAAPDGIGATEGSANGSVTPNGAATTAWFEWGTDPTLAVCEETGHVSVGSGDAAVPVSFHLSDLTPGETYFYRAVARDAGGTSRGGIDWFSTDPEEFWYLEVNTLEDVDPAPAGKMTLRRAIELVDWYGTIVFHPILDGGTIRLRIVGDAHTILPGEVYSTGMPSTYQGYFERDYGKSALFSARDFTIDAGGLANGITVSWDGGSGEKARVLAIYGNLTMNNVTISGGWSSAEPTGDEAQPFTLARGGGLAVWGYANLDKCTVGGNRISGEPAGSRDRGVYGGGVYANGLSLTDCIVSGNRAEGFGAAGGGIYSVGGADSWGNDCTLTGCTISGNRVTAQHAYGGGLFSLAGGPDSLANMTLANCTIARNLVEDNPALAQSNMSQYYCRGGGVYMGGGNALTISACTIAENAVSGYAHTFSGKPNLGGGGVGATIGNAHVVEYMDLQQSVVAGNTLNGAPNDLFTGSLLHFYSSGYNLIGRLDFSQMLVPIPEWSCLTRKHYPNEGDADGVATADALALAGVRRHPTLLSAGTDAGEPAVLWYPPAGRALNRVPSDGYEVTDEAGGYSAYGDSSDGFLNLVLDYLDANYASELGQDFGAQFRAAYGDPTGVTWFLSPSDWPSMAENAPWIKFWRDLDTALAGRLGTVGLGDDFWRSFADTYATNDFGLYIDSYLWYSYPTSTDQLGNQRPARTHSNIGAIETAAPPGFWWRW
jgi:hypothetical protein